MMEWREIKWDLGWRGAGVRWAESVLCRMTFSESTATSPTADTMSAQRCLSWNVLKFGKQCLYLCVYEYICVCYVGICVCVVCVCGEGAFSLVWTVLYLYEDIVERRGILHDLVEFMYKVEDLEDASVWFSFKCDWMELPNCYFFDVWNG